MTDVRRALWAVVAGAALNLVVLPLPVVGDYWDDQSDSAQITVIADDRAQFAVAFGLAGLGVLIVGIGLFMLGMAIAPAEAERSQRRELAARIGGWSGLIVAAVGLSELLHAMLATPEFYVDSAVRTVGMFGGGIALLIAMVVLGVLAWSAPPPKWTAVVLVVGGLLNFLPEVAFIALLVFAVANLIAIRRADTSNVNANLTC